MHMDEEIQVWVIIIVAFLSKAKSTFEWKFLTRVWLCDPMDCSPLGSTFHGILQARILEWVAIPFSRGSSQPRDRTGLLELWEGSIILVRFNLWQEEGEACGWKYFEKCFAISLLFLSYLCPLTHYGEIHSHHKLHPRHSALESEGMPEE